jgi:hypothetical protein
VRSIEAGHAHAQPGRRCDLGKLGDQGAQDAFDLGLPLHVEVGTAAAGLGQDAALAVRQQGHRLRRTGVDTDDERQATTGRRSHG